MLKSMRVRVVTRDVSPFPHKDLENVPLITDLQVFWGENKLPTGYVTVLELGDCPLDFRGGVDLTGQDLVLGPAPEEGEDDAARSASTADTSPQPTYDSPDDPPRRKKGKPGVHKKSTRRPATKRAYGRRRGARADAEA